MRIVWWNLGHAYTPWILNKYFGTPLPSWGPHYSPSDGPVIREFLSHEKADVFAGCEVLSEKDAETVRFSPGARVFFAPSAYKDNGRVVVSERSFTTHGTGDQVFFDFGEFALVPLHLHWKDTKRRLEEAKECIEACKAFEKPVIVVGDFNTWMLFGWLYLFSNDRAALKTFRSLLVEKTAHIVSTELGLPIKLDYVFVSPELVDRVKVAKLKTPLPNLDHRPLAIDISLSTPLSPQA